MEQATLDLEVVSSSPKLGIGITLKNTHTHKHMIKEGINFNSTKLSCT